jgi:hypothetical protein
MDLLRPTRLLISEKSATYTIKWSYTIIWQVRVIREQGVIFQKKVNHTGKQHTILIKQVGWKKF